MTDIIIFGGTSEGRRLAEFCAARKIRAAVSVATGYGESLLKETPWLGIHTGRMDREQMEALLKIRTEKVDLKSALAKELEEQYLMGDGGEGHRTEAAIFAQAMTTFQLSFLEDGSVQFSTEYVTRTFLAVMLKILGLEHDRETVSFLKRKLSLADGAADRHADKTANEAAHGA